MQACLPRDSDGLELNSSCLLWTGDRLLQLVTALTTPYCISQITAKG